MRTWQQHYFNALLIYCLLRKFAGKRAANYVRGRQMESEARSGTKPIYKSKIFWTQVMVALIAILADPSLGNVVPMNYLPALVWVGGILTIVMRSFFSGTPISLGVVGGEDGSEPRG